MKCTNPHYHLFIFRDKHTLTYTINTKKTSYDVTFLIKTYVALLQHAAVGEEAVKGR